MSKKSDSNNLTAPLQEISQDIVRAWKHRNDIRIPFTNKIIKNKQKIPTIIQETIDNLWRKEELKPLIVDTKHNKENPNKYIFVIHLPHGVVSYNDFKVKENYFYDAVNGDIQIERRGKVVILTVLTGNLETEYLYNFDPSLYPKMFLPFPVGISVNGLVVRDLGKFPYMLEGGLPDFGKSNMLHIINTALLTGRYDTCFIVTIDFKRSEYATYMNDYGILITDDKSAYTTLLLLEKELERRMDYCASHSKQKIHNMPLSIRPPWIVLEVDEITELQDKYSQLALNRIMRLGRAYGFCTILATQKPSARTFRNETFTETRSLCAARLCFHIMEEEDSKMILNNTKGVNIPPVSGRGIFKHGRDELLLQTMFIDPEYEIPRILSGIPKPINNHNNNNQKGVYTVNDYYYKDESKGITANSNYPNSKYPSVPQLIEEFTEQKEFNKPSKRLPPR